MAESHILGKKGEDHASAFLESSGFKILCRNWTWGKNEIDIIAEKDNKIIFIEVKTRNEGFLGDIRDLVSVSKQRSVIFAADGYLKKFRIDRESRFDVLIIIRNGDNFEIEHREDAFYPTLR